MSNIATFSVSLVEVSDTEIAAAKTHAAFTSNDVAIQVNVTGRSVALADYNQAQTGGTIVCTPGSASGTSNPEKLGSLMSLLLDVFGNGPFGWEESA